MHLETRNICIASSHSLQFDAITLKTKTRNIFNAKLWIQSLFRALLRRNKETVNWLFCETDLPCLFMKNVYALRMWQKKKTKTTFCFCSSHIVIYGHNVFFHEQGEYLFSQLASSKTMNVFDGRQYQVLTIVHNSSIDH